MLHKFIGFATRDYPDAKILIASWDFYGAWRGEEVEKFLKTVDKNRVIVWDYSADLEDCVKKSWAKPAFENWGVKGKFPYTYSIFLAYENALDTRANYPLIEARQREIMDDPYTDYSLWESYQRLDAVEKIRNPEFSKTLFENASCGYCRSHQYELARHWYAPHVRKVARRVGKAVVRNDRKAKFFYRAERERLALKAKPLESLKPTLPRTAENFRKLMREIDALLK